jgi:hypothetical protein
MYLYAYYYTDLFFDDIGYMLYLDAQFIGEQKFAFLAATFDSNYEFDCSQEYSVTGYTSGSESVYALPNTSGGGAACSNSNTTVTISPVTT